MSLILALYPNSRGLGFACVEMPSRLVEFGIVTVRPVNNERIRGRIEKFIGFFKPEIVVIRDSETGTPRDRRIALLIEDVKKLGQATGVPVYSYSRQQVKDVFEVFGEKTKYGIAHKIIKWFPELEDHAPRIRRPWMDEDYYMGIFDALALAITHAYLTE